MLRSNISFSIYKESSKTFILDKLVLKFTKQIAGFTQITIRIFFPKRQRKEDFATYKLCAFYFFSVLNLYKVCNCIGYFFLNPPLLD